MKQGTGDRDEWRGVGDVSEIGMDFGDRMYSGGWWSRTDLSEIHWRLVSHTIARSFEALVLLLAERLPIPMSGDPEGGSLDEEGTAIAEE